MGAAFWPLFIIGLLLLAGGVFFWFRRKKPLSAPVSPLPDHDFEIAGELAVPAAKAETTSPTEPRVSPAPPYDELPLAYGDNRIVLMVRDPEWLFAYWEINNQTKAEFARRFGSYAWDGSQPLIKVYDTTGVIFDGTNANDTQDVWINDYANSWHINVGKPDRVFVAEIGRVINGQFVCLARSNTVTTPRNRVSDLVDEEWMLLEDLDEVLYGRYAYGISSVYLAPSSAQIAEHQKTDSQ